MPAVVIAATHLTASLREQLSSEGELLTFADTEAIQALQAILEQQPNLIVLERLFAATPRGAALINRIKTDPLLTQAEVRVMSHTGDYLRQISRPAVAASAAAGADGRRASAPEELAAPVPEAASEGRPVDWHGTRRVARTRVRTGVELQLDGNAAGVVDVSTMGAQVLSPTILRPNQKVRVNITDDEVVLRFRGTIIWATYELGGPGGRPVYRAGVEFVDSDGAALERFSARVAQ
ncbi:MAG: PilZ domain-containing protein [Vicinamibacterales bacterium]